MKNSVSTSVSKNETKINAIMNVIAAEAKSTRAIVSTLWDARNNEVCKEIAGVIFADCNEETSRKVILSAGCKRLQKLYPVKMITSNGRPVCAKRINVAKNLFKYVEVEFLAALKMALTNYYDGGKQQEVKEGIYYDKNGNIIDAKAAEEAIKEKEAKKAKNKAKKEQEAAAKNVDDTDILTLLNAARKKTNEGSELYNAIMQAIKLAE